MNEGSPPLFVEDDVLDEVSSTSTYYGEDQEEYAVDEILHEAQVYDSDEGKEVTKYLGICVCLSLLACFLTFIVSWERYPLHESTYEPSKSLQALFLYPF